MHDEAHITIHRLKAIEIADLEVQLWSTKRDYASVQLERAKLKFVLAKRASETGKDPMPLNAEAAQRHLDEIDARPDPIAVLKDVREACLFADDHNQIGVSEDVVIPKELFDRITSTIKEHTP